MCLCPLQPAGTPLHLHPVEASERCSQGHVLGAVPLNEGDDDMKTRFHLARADQFVVFELSQLSSQCQVRVHQEGFSATLIEILER